MGMIDKIVEKALIRRREMMAEEIEELTRELGTIHQELTGLRQERAALNEELALSDQVITLKRKVSDLEIQRAQKQEEQDRKVRETEHRVGLLRVQQEHDVENAKRETMLEVRESNLSKDKERFEQEMKFQREHMQREVDRIESVLGQVLERLPNVELAMSGSIKPKKTKDTPEE